MCELCAPNGHANGAVAFTAGLLSALPATLHLPLDEIVGQLALAPELRTALLAHEGPVGHVLGWVLAYETRDQRKLAELGAPPTIANTFVEAVEWSTNLTNALARTRP